MKRFIASIALAACAFSAWALPSVDDVQAAVRNGNYTQAESMMLEVVTAKPDSARAHYLYAEILAHDKRFSQASEEAARAKRLDPTLGFTQPDKFRSFEQLLEREQGAARSAASPRVAAPSIDRAPAQATSARAPIERSSGVPTWVWVLGAAAVAFMVWRLVQPRQSAPAMGQPNGYGQPGAAAPYGAGGPGFGPGYASGYGPGGVPMQGGGNGMLGTGLAVAGGLAAGVMAEKFLEGRRDNGLGGSSGGGIETPAGGFFGGGGGGDNGAARELEQRDVDFGNGGNDWGADPGGSGGGDGGSSSDDGGW